MAVTYEPVATVVLSAGVTNIAFTSIPTTWTDLKFVFNGYTNNGGQYEIIFNSDTSFVYNRSVLYGTGGNNASLTNLANNGMGNITDSTAANTDYPETITLDIFNYTNAVYKTWLYSRSSERLGISNTTRLAGSQAVTTAISGIRISTTGGSVFSIGSSATIYGIKAA